MIGFKRDYRSLMVKLEAKQHEIDTYEDDFSSQEAKLTTDLKKISAFVDQKQGQLDLDDSEGQKSAVNDIIEELSNLIFELQDDLNNEIEFAAKYEAQKNHLLSTFPQSRSRFQIYLPIETTSIRS
ncbi:hypothetical protein GEMRC1_008732 [Eukaryota sp. GEM-RC1]